MQEIIDSPTVSTRSCMSFFCQPPRGERCRCSRNTAKPKEPVQVKHCCARCPVSHISPRYDLVVVDMPRLGLTRRTRSSQYAILPSSMGSTTSPGRVGSPRLFRSSKTKSALHPRLWSPSIDANAVWLGDCAPAACETGSGEPGGGLRSRGCHGCQSSTLASRSPCKSPKQDTPSIMGAISGSNEAKSAVICDRKLGG